MVGRYGGGEFNSNLAMRGIHRSGLAGAAWIRQSSSTPQPHEVHMRVAVGTSGKVMKHWSKQRPLSATLRAQEARRSVSCEPGPLERDHITPYHERNHKNLVRVESSESAASRDGAETDIIFKDLGPGGQSSPSVAGPSSPSGSRRVHYGNAPIGGGAGGNGVPIARSPTSGMRTNGSSPTSQKKSTLLDVLKRPPSPRTNKKIAELCAQMCSKMSTAVQAFKTFDKDGSGSLTVEEIMDGLTAIGIEYDKEILLRMIENADLSYDGSIEYPEFIRFFVGKFVPQSDLDENQVKKDRALVLLRQLITAAFDENEDGISSEELLTCFRSFDQDGDGWVSPEELEEGLMSLGLKDRQTAHLISELLTESDENEDGKINYNEFISLSGLKGKDRAEFDLTGGGAGGAMHGFKLLSNYDQAVMKRLGHGIEPDTPKGHTAWRKRYMKPYFGNKYLSESEKQAKAIVDQRAAEGFKDPPVIMTGASKTYMKFVLGAEQDDKGEWSRLDTHVNREWDQPWGSHMHESLAVPFQGKHRKTAPLPRVDQQGVSMGMRIPSTKNALLARETGPYRRVSLLPEEWKTIQDSAVRQSVELGSENARKVFNVRGEGKEKLSSSRRELRPPNWLTIERHKPLRKIAESQWGADDEAGQGFDITRMTNGTSLRGPIDTQNPFSRFGGMWSLLDTAGNIMDQTQVRTAPPHPQIDTKPLVTPAFEHRPETTAPGMLPNAGKPTTDGDAYIFHSPPMSRDLFARTVLGGPQSSGGLLPSHLFNKGKTQLKIQEYASKKASAAAAAAAAANNNNAEAEAADAN